MSSSSVAVAALPAPVPDFVPGVPEPELAPELDPKPERGPELGGWLILSPFRHVVSRDADYLVGTSAVPLVAAWKCLQ